MVFFKDNASFNGRNESSLDHLISVSSKSNKGVFVGFNKVIMAWSEN